MELQVASVTEMKERSMEEYGKLETPAASFYGIEGRGGGGAQEF